MSDIISSSKGLRELMKESESLIKSSKSVKKKIDSKIEKILASNFKNAISSNKWYIIGNDLDRHDTFKSKSKAFISYYNVKLGVDRDSATNSAPTKKSLKGMKYTDKVPKTIKSYEDLISLTEVFMVYSFTVKEIAVFLYSDYMSIACESGFDEIWAFLKSVEIRMDLSHNLRDIERIEADLEARKNLINSMSKQLLFSI